MFNSTIRGLFNHVGSRKQKWWKNIKKPKDLIICYCWCNAMDSASIIYWRTNENVSLKIINTVIIFMRQ